MSVSDQFPPEVVQPAHSDDVGAPIKLSVKEAPFHVTKLTLKERIADEVLRLFRISLIGTLAFAAILVLIDSAYIVFKIITPEQRLVSQNVVMTFVTATVVQVGAALAAIVVAVFNDRSA